MPSGEAPSLRSAPFPRRSQRTRAPRDVAPTPDRIQDEPGLPRPSGTTTKQTDCPPVRCSSFHATNRPNESSVGGAATGSEDVPCRAGSVARLGCRATCFHGKCPRTSIGSCRRTAGRPRHRPSPRASRFRRRQHTRPCLPSPPARHRGRRFDRCCHVRTSPQQPGRE